MTKKKGAVAQGTGEAETRAIAPLETGVSRDTPHLLIARRTEELDATLPLAGGTKWTAIVHAIAPLLTIVISHLDEMGDTEITMTVILPRTSTAMAALIGEALFCVEIHTKGTTRPTEEVSATMAIVATMDAKITTREGVVDTEIGAFPGEEVMKLLIVGIMVVTGIVTVHPVVGGTVHHVMRLWRGHACN